MNDSTPQIKWKRKITFNSGSFRIPIPTEIAEAFGFEHKDEIIITIEGKKIILEPAKK